MSAAEAAIPYQKTDPRTSRTCGAACLSMVYGSFGKEIPQGQIWPAIAKKNRFGSLSSTTHLMARDALSRGFDAVAIQTRHPLQALRLCRDSGIRAILNHRLQRDSPAGHYTVLVDIDEANVVLHDPFTGPSRRLAHAELLELWQPRLPDSEIVGNVLIGVAAPQPPAAPACQVCRTPLPSAVACPQCKQAVSLQPAAVLGCMGHACVARMWNYICCPSCDYTWTFNLQPPPAGESAGASSPPSPDPRAAWVSAEDPWKLKGLFGEIDKFCGHIMSLPVSANRPEIKQHIDFILAGKNKLKLAEAEDLANRMATQERLAAMVRTAKQREAAHLKRMEDLNTPSPPLDGNALGHALLKNLGFTG
jgi:Peptidase C39 family